jgi:hypothetical protein
MMKEIILSVILMALGNVVQFNSASLIYPEIHHKNWTRSEKLDPNGILNLQWYLKNNEIVFHVILNSRGFVAIGFPYSNPQIKKFDVVYAWVNDKTGKANILVNVAHIVYINRRRRISMHLYVLNNILHFRFT